MYNLSGMLEVNKETNVLKVKVEETVYGPKKYTVVNYDKKKLASFQYESYGLFRSVILDESGQFLCFSPPKSIDAGTFIKMYQDPTRDDIICEETVEGIMINAFYDVSCETWQLFTKQKIATKVYGGHIITMGGSKMKITMDDLFCDTFKEVTGHSLASDEYLNKKYCYSFVLQHPSTPIVLPCKRANITCVAAYLIEGHIVTRMHAFSLPPGIFIPRRYNIVSPSISISVEEQLAAMTYNAFIEAYASMNASYMSPGITIYNRTTGERCKVRNPAYETIRHLKGADLKLMYQYLEIRKNHSGLMETYLQHFPENRKKFQDFRDQLYLFTQTIYDNYVKCHIKKEIQLADVPKQYKTHVYNLHKIYLEELVSNKRYINFRRVVQYVNELHTSQLIFSLTAPIRQTVPVLTESTI